MLFSYLPTQSEQELLAGHEIGVWFKIDVNDRQLFEYFNIIVAITHNLYSIVLSLLHDAFHVFIISVLFLVL